MSTTEAANQGRQTSRVQEAIEQNSIEREDGEQLAVIRVYGVCPKGEVVGLQIGPSEEEIDRWCADRVLADHFDIDGDAVTSELRPLLNMNYVSNNRVAELLINPDTGLAVSVGSFPHLIRSSMQLSSDAEDDVLKVANGCV